MDSHRHRAELRARRDFCEGLRRKLDPRALRRAMAGARLWLRPLGAAVGGIFGALVPLWGMYPLGIGLCGALIGGPFAPAAGIGTLLGSLISGGETGLRYAAAVAGVLLAGIPLRAAGQARRTVVGPLAAAAFALLSSIAAALVAGDISGRWLLALCEAVLAGGVALVLRTALGPACNEGAETRREVARILIAALTLGALGGVELIWGLRLGGLLLAGTVLWLALHRRGAGLTLALTGGLLLDALAMEGPKALAVLPLAAGAASLFLPLGHTVACAVWMLCGTCAALWAKTPAMVGEMLAAGAAGLFLPLPAENPREEMPALRAQAFAEQRLDGCAAAYEAVCAALQRDKGGEVQNLENPAEILRLAADEACVACPRSVECWGTAYHSTRDQLCTALQGLMTRGRVLREDLPPPFAASCVRFAEFLSALNRELCIFLYRNRLRNALEESREILCAQYGDFAHLLREQAATIGRAMHFYPKAERRLMRLWSERGLRVSATVYSDEHNRLFAELEGTGTARFAADEQRETARISEILHRPMMLAEMESGSGGTRLYFREYDRLRLEVQGACGRAAGERTSGDRTAFLRLRSGRCYILFSDGMGHGKEAADEARRALQLLENHLRAGITAELALRIVTGVLLLRDGGTAFATVDMLEFDPVSGDASLYKCGAAPTWLLRSGKVERVDPAGEPVGLSLAPAARRRILLRPGDRVLMVSDGISDGEEDGWVGESLAACAEASAADIAETILRHTEATDDRTVIAIAISARDMA